MRDDTLRTILTVIILVILFAITISILKFLIRVLLPIAIIIVAGYIVFKVFTASRNRNRF